jgi:dCMP deaminase
MSGLFPPRDDSMHMKNAPYTDPDSVWLDTEPEGTHITMRNIQEDLKIDLIPPSDAEAEKKIRDLIDDMERQNIQMSLAFQEAIDNQEKAFTGILELPKDYNPKPARPSFDDTFMESARTWAKRSTCPRANVGCVIASSDNHTLSTGYNGAPSGAKHCLEIGCIPDNYGHCSRSVHAELNAITQAAKRGTSLNGGTAYLTLMPCLTCAKALIQVGVKRLVWEHDYLENSSERDILIDLLEECGVDWGIYNLSFL